MSDYDEAFCQLAAICDEICIDRGLLRIGVPATFIRTRYYAFSIMPMEILDLGCQKRHNTLATWIYSRALYRPCERSLRFSQQRLSLCDNDLRCPLRSLQILSPKNQLLTFFRIIFRRISLPLNLTFGNRTKLSQEPGWYTLCFA